MIPKVIHYCWFGGGPLPNLARKCIKSWKKYLPDYEIIEWNESNFDMNINSYVKEAYQEKKYAFVSDFARFWILYNYGGLYFDTDVEIIRGLDHIIAKGAFWGCERMETDTMKGLPLVNPGLGMGSKPCLPFYQEMINFYSKIHFINSDGTLNQHTVVEYTTNLLMQYGLKKTEEIQECADIYIYPKDFFCPISYPEMIMRKTSNTVSIHHFAGSWLPWEERIKKKYPHLSKKFPKLFYYCVELPIYKLQRYGGKSKKK